jgi:hypothetical protein
MNLWIFDNIAFVVLHVSVPYKSTDFTFELKKIIFVPLEMFLTQCMKKTSLLEETSIKLGIRPNESKTKVMKINAKHKQPIKIKDTNLEEVEEFTYLGSIVNIEGGTDADVKKPHHCVQTDPAKNVWTRAYLIQERTRTVRRQEEGKNYVYLFVFCMNLEEINALLTISCSQMKHFGYVIVVIML